MHKPEPVLENETREILFDFEIEMDHWIPAWSWFCRSSEPQSETERKRKDWQILGPCQRTKNVVEREGNDDTKCSCWDGLQRFGKKTEEIENQKKNRDHPNPSRVKLT